MKYILDTDTCVYLIKKHPPQVLEKFKHFPAHKVGISSITLAELEYGVTKSNFPQKNQLALNDFSASLDVLNFDEKAASCYGEIRAYLQKQGTPIGPFDLLIAAQAKSLHATLVTNNTKEFARIKGLLLANWTTE